MKQQFNSYLKSLSSSELIKELQNLYKKFEPVRTFYTLRLNENNDQIITQLKEKIRKEYYPSKGFGKARNNRPYNE